MPSVDTSRVILGGRRIRTRRLDDGLFIVACESRAAPVAALQVWVGVGSADERDDQAGIAHVHEHMLFKGTAKRGVGEIAAEVERSGGEINAWTSYDQTVYHVVIASRFFDAGLDILADAILSSSFDPQELAKELEVILEEIKRSEDSPSAKTSRALFKTAFTAHPYRRPVIGYADVVRSFTRENILDFYRSHYCADRMTVVAVGDFDADEAVDRITARFRGVRAQGATLPPRDVEPKQDGLRARGLVDDVEESHLAIGFRGPRLLDDDVYAVDVLGVVLGQGDSSRLSTRVKREMGLVNEIYAYSYTPRDPGLIVVGATLRHDKIDDALSAVGRELDRVARSPVSAEELEKAKAMLASEAIYQRETVEGLARRLGSWASLTGDPSFEDRYQERIAAVTADDVAAAAERYFRREHATVVALAPRDAAAVVDEKRLAERAVDALGRAPRGKARTSSTAPASAATTLFHLDGGARLVVERDRTNPIVSLRAVWLGGLRAETDETAGWSHLTAEMATKGTRRRGAVEISTIVDAMAGHLDGFAGRNSLGLRATFLAPSLARGFELFAECVHEPAFDPAELERTRDLVLEDLRARADNPAGLAFDLFAKTLWTTHPYRRDILGTPSSVRAATSDGLRAFWQGRAAPAQAVFALVGDVDPERVAAMVEASLTSARRVDGAAAPTPAPVVEPAPGERRVARLVRPKAQAHLVVGHRGIALTDPDRFALEIVSSTLSGQGGRLFLELRDKRSLCYAVSAFSVEGIDPGSFAVYMGTSPEKVDTALAGIEELLERLAAEGITAAELDRSKRYLVGSHDIGLQRLGARGSAMALNELYGLGYQNHVEYAARIEGVQLDDVRRVAARLLDPTKRVVSIVGPEGTGGPAANFEPARTV